jgi:hypothetical protein
MNTRKLRGGSWWNNLKGKVSKHFDNLKSIFKKTKKAARRADTELKQARDEQANAEKKVSAALLDFQACTEEKNNILRAAHEARQKTKVAIQKKIQTRVVLNRLKQNKSSFKIVFLFGIFFGSFVLVGEVAENQFYKTKIDWANYKDFESARYQIQDNLIERNLASNPNRYGWTDAEYLIFDDYLYADPSVFTTDKLKLATDSNLNKNDFNIFSLYRQFQENSRNPLFPWTGVIAALMIFGITSVFIQPERILSGFVKRIFGCRCSKI